VDVVFFVPGVGSAVSFRSAGGSVILQVVAVLETKTLVGVSCRSRELGGPASERGLQLSKLEERQTRIQ
jgi:hypothetical protein